MKASKNCSPVETTKAILVHSISLVLTLGFILKTRENAGSPRNSDTHSMSHSFMCLSLFFPRKQDAPLAHSYTCLFCSLIHLSVCFPRYSHSAASLTHTHVFFVTASVAHTLVCVLPSKTGHTHSMSLTHSYAWLCSPLENSTHTHTHSVSHSLTRLLPLFL